MLCLLEGENKAGLTGCAFFISQAFIGHTVKTSGMDIRNHQKRGQRAELRFMINAIELAPVHRHSG